MQKEKSTRSRWIFIRKMEYNMHVYLYYFVPDRPVTNSVPQGGVPVMPTGQELRFWGVDGQSPELISVTLQRTETNRSSLKYYSQHPGALQHHEPWLTAHAGISPICFSSSLTEAEEGDVTIKHRKNLLFVTLSYVLLLHRMNVFGGLAGLARTWVMGVKSPDSVPCRTKFLVVPIKITAPFPSATVRMGPNCSGICMEKISNVIKFWAPSFKILVCLLWWQLLSQWHTHMHVLWRERKYVSEWSQILHLNSKHLIYLKKNQQ